MVYEGYAAYIGRLETTARSVEEARKNLRYQLYRDCGWKWYDAMHADLEPVRPVRHTSFL